MLVIISNAETTSTLLKLAKASRATLASLIVHSKVTIGVIMALLEGIVLLF